MDYLQDSEASPALPTSGMAPTQIGKRPREWPSVLPCRTAMIVNWLAQRMMRRRLYVSEEIAMAKRAKTTRSNTKRAQTKTAKKSRSGRTRDRKLVAGGQKHEVRYAAKKAGVKDRAVKKAVKRVGNRRTRVEQVLTSVRKAVKRVAQAPAKAVEALSSGNDSAESSSPETKSES
jgi:hypothetical protein